MSEKNQDKARTYLKSTHLKGYKSIKDVKIGFHPNLNIIIGKNAAGKTNFLEFLDKTLVADFDGLIDFKTSLIFQDRNTYEQTASRKLLLESLLLLSRVLLLISQVS